MSEVLLVILIALLFSVRREQVITVLIVGCFYLPMSKRIDLVGSMHFFRILVAFGLIRLFFRNERINESIKFEDKLVALLSGWLLLASFFHDQASGYGSLAMTGMILSMAGSYYISRVCVTDEKSLSTILKWILLSIIPMAIFMCIEHIFRENMLAALFGDTNTGVTVREGKVRARGLFWHPILAGTVGAGLFPLALSMWSEHKRLAFISGTACIVVVFASASSGPLIGLFAGLGILMTWQWRSNARKVFIASILCYIVLDLLSSRPFYFSVITRLDLTGSSTSYYRALLIDTAIKHFSEWGLIGANSTGHWFPDNYGIRTMGGQHLDLTNYYLILGVAGGLLVVILFVWIVLLSMDSAVTATIPGVSIESSKSHIHPTVPWYMAASVFSFAVSGISVSYFDQSIIVLWTILGITVSSSQLICGESEYTNDSSAHDT